MKMQPLSFLHYEVVIYYKHFVAAFEQHPIILYSARINMKSYHASYAIHFVS
jgi:hypothetical protein